MITASLFVAALAAAPAPPADDVPLQARLRRLLDLVERDRRTYRIPGAALGVIVDGEVVLAAGLGVADLSSGARVTPDTVFAIGSVTKSFTAVLAGMLAEDGLLDLDDPLGEHLDGLSIRGAEDPTIRQALAHCTGLAHMPLLEQCSDLTPDELLAYVANAEPPLSNRLGLSYSNVGFTLGGEAIARAGGASWHELVRERILEPLGMTRTTTTLAAREALDDVARGYDVFGEADGVTHSAAAWDAESVAPAAALSASLDDVLAYARMLTLGGRVDDRALIGEGTLEDLWLEFVPITPMTSYGTGFVVNDEHETRIVHHAGNVPGYAAQVAVMPDEDAAVVLLSNVMFHPLQEDVLGHAAACLFDDELPPIEPRAPYPTDLELYTGRFLHDTTESYLEVFARDGRLFVDLPGETVHELLPPDDEGRFRIALNDDVAFSFPDPGEQGVLPRDLTMHRFALSSVRPRLSDRVHYAPPLADLLGAPIDAPLLVVGTRDHPHQGVFGDLAIHVGRGRRVRETSDLGRLGETVVVVDGARGWTRATTGHVTELAGDQLVSHLAATAGVYAGRWDEVYESLELRTQMWIDREEAYLVRATRADGTPDGLVFAADGRLLRLRTRIDHGVFGWTSIETHFDDWREVGGRLVPFAATSEGLQFGRIETAIELVLLDAPMPADAFEPLGEGR